MHTNQNYKSNTYLYKEAKGMIKAS